ncbi:MAG: hypothetical protein H7Z42_03040, partial [Roseiflexaceae bacterium]|nr:hypothetical protein [Roseiflexaceae bacterium]
MRRAEWSFVIGALLVFGFLLTPLAGAASRTGSPQFQAATATGTGTAGTATTASTAA